MIRFAIALSVALALLTSSANADEPPIKLTLTPAKPPTPALRYQLLPDARITIDGDAAPLYRQVIDLLAKKTYRENAERIEEWKVMPVERLPRADVRKLLDEYKDAFALLDKSACHDHCDWGFRKRIKEKGFDTTLPETDPMRTCARLLAVRARLAIAEERYGEALQALRTGFALAKHLGETETLISYLIGVAIAAEMQKQLDAFVSQPGTPNLYYALTDLPIPLVRARTALESERLGLYATFPDLAAAGADLQAGNMPDEKIEATLKKLNALTRRDSNTVDRVVLARTVLARHEAAKKALIAAGRPRDKVEAMSQLQVALLHGLLEYESVFDEILVAESLPQPERIERYRQIDQRLLAAANKEAAAPAISFTELIPAFRSARRAGARADRRVAMLRCVEAIRYYAAAHDGQLPPSLADINDVRIPLDPVTGRAFQYRVTENVATLTGPAPGKESPSEANYLRYQLRIRK